MFGSFKKGHCKPNFHARTPRPFFKRPGKLLVYSRTAFEKQQQQKIPDGLNLIVRNMTQGKLSDIIVE